MKELFRHLKYDWRHHRGRVMFESLAAVCAVIFVAVFVCNAGHLGPTLTCLLLMIQAFGCSCGIVYGALRHSINIVFLNAVMALFSLWGLWKLI